MISLILGIYSMLIRLKFMTSLIRHAFLLLLDLKVIKLRHHF